MDERRALLKELANSTMGSWAAAHRPPIFDGETRVETRNTVYAFVDGVCCAVTRQDGTPSPTASDFIGMRIVGWLLGGGGQPTVAQAWRPGAYAVLWRQQVVGANLSTFALTSPSTAFVPASQEALVAPPPSSSGLGSYGWAPAPPKPREPASASQARVVDVATADLGPRNGLFTRPPSRSSHNLEPPFDTRYASKPPASRPAPNQRPNLITLPPEVIETRPALPSTPATELDLDDDEPTRMAAIPAEILRQTRTKSVPPALPSSRPGALAPLAKPTSQRPPPLRTDGPMTGTGTAPTSGPVSGRASTLLPPAMPTVKATPPALPMQRPSTPPASVRPTLPSPQAPATRPAIPPPPPVRAAAPATPPKSTPGSGWAPAGQGAKAPAPVSSHPRSTPPPVPTSSGVNASGSAPPSSAAAGAPKAEDAPAATQTPPSPPRPRATVPRPRTDAA